MLNSLHIHNSDHYDKYFQNENDGCSDSARNWLDKQLRASGLFDKMEAMGVQDGDTVVMYDLQFEYQR